MCHKLVSGGVECDSKFTAVFGVTSFSRSHQTCSLGFTYDQWHLSVSVCGDCDVSKPLTSHCQLGVSLKIYHNRCSDRPEHTATHTMPHTDANTKATFIDFDTCTLKCTSFHFITAFYKQAFDLWMPARMIFSSQVTRVPSWVEENFKRNFSKMLVNENYKCIKINKTTTPAASICIPLYSLAVLHFGSRGGHEFYL